MRQRQVVLLLLVLLAPGALAHGEEPHVEPGRDTETGQSTAPLEGYTGPGMEPYVSYIEGVWLYGQASVTPLGHQVPRNMRAWGDWIVWEDASRGDIYVHSISGGTGYYLTSDEAPQRRPDIWGNVVVYEDYQSAARVDVQAHFLDTGETRLLSTGRGNHRSPSIHGDLVAWEDDRGGTGDIWGIRLTEGREFPIHQSPDKEMDPLVLDGIVYFRTYRFNVWDVLAYDLEGEEQYQVTSDLAIQSAPRTNGRDVFFLSQNEGGWRLERYDATRDRVTPTVIRAADTTPIALQGELAIQQARVEGGKVQLVARNLSAGTTTHVSGNLVITTDPVFHGSSVYVAVVTKNGTSLLALEVSPFAFGRPPALNVVSPNRAVMPWTRPLVVSGVLTTGPGWAEPVTFTYRVNGGPPQAVPPGASWSVTLDNAGMPEGNHRVLFRATFREGPPVETALTLVVPQRNAQVDVGKLGPEYHAAKTFAALNAYVISNPASWFLIPLALVIGAMLLVRLWIVVRPRREIIVAEYVPQDDP